MDEKELERLAKEELLNEAKRGKIRAETMGAMGWQKCPVPSTNKRFLTNMIRSTLEPSKKKEKPKDYDDKEKPQRHNRDYDERRHETKYETCDHRRDSSRAKHRQRQEEVPSRKSRHKKHKTRYEKS